MKSLYKFTMMLIVCISIVFIKGWILGAVYVGGIVPFIEYIGYNAPYIPITMFILLSLSYSIVFGKSDNKDDIEDSEFWSKLFSKYGAKILLVFVLWLLNVILL